MAWTHDTGYPPAYEHDGYTASILLDGSDTSATSAAVEPHVIGWRAACNCGWRGLQFYSRAEWPSPTGTPPTFVDGGDTDSGTFADWQAHLDRALPDLAVHDYARELAAVKAGLDAAVHAARRAGVPWTVIGRAAGMAPDRAA